MKFYRGIIFTYPHGEYFREGLKQCNIRAKRFPSIINKNLLVIENKKALGIIVFTDIITVKRNKIKKYLKSCHVSKEEFETWWSKDIEEFYIYPMETIKIFKKPISIDYKKNGARTLVKPDSIIID